MTLRIGLTYNLKPADATGDQFEEFDSLETVEALEGALRARGHSTLRLGWGEEMLAVLDRERVDGVFNFAEGVGGRGRESQVPAMLQMLGIPHTASEALTIAITLDKPLAKLLAKAHGIATSPWYVESGGQAILPVRTDKIVRPPRGGIFTTSPSPTSRSPTSTARTFASTRG